MNIKIYSILSRVMIIGVSFLLMTSVSQASDCAWKFQHAYDKGTKHGQIDGAHKKSHDPSRHNHNLWKKIENGSDKEQSRNQCYAEGYSDAYDHAHKKAEKPHSDKGAPKAGTNERAYYDDGCYAGTGDAQAGMSRYYGRHSDGYDSRFEPYFRAGYKKCWGQYR